MEITLHKKETYLSEVSIYLNKNQCLNELLQVHLINSKTFQSYRYKYRIKYSLLNKTGIQIQQFIIVIFC